MTNCRNIVILCVLASTVGDGLTDSFNPNISKDHIPYYTNLCSYIEQEHLRIVPKEVNHTVCWGYERGCLPDRRYSKMKCPGDHKGWVRSKSKQIEAFYSQADFGYVKNFRDSLEEYCVEIFDGGSSLQCSEQMQFCRAKNLLISFEDLPSRVEPVRYHMDVLSKGKIGGNCKLNRNRLKENLQFLSPLQSWSPELRYFSEIKNKIGENSSVCDVWVEKPAIIIKIDASVSMYHHFCDFFNLYASQHVNFSDPSGFSTNTQVLIWETYPYLSNFQLAWKAFTEGKIWDLNNVKGKKVCFKSVIFPLLARMPFGLYYNTPIIWGCEGSGLFHAFSHHMLHRLGIDEREFTEKKLHITILTRRTKHRRIINEDELVRVLEETNEYVVRRATYTHVDSFYSQLQQDQWTDILIGMHGSGLTHLLFLPDWATVFELYNCGDPNCYQDLARLRGVNYITWENQQKVYPQDEGHHPQLGAHEKFTDYKFDPDEFLELVKRAAKSVRKHPLWKSKLKKRPKLDEL